MSWGGPLIYNIDLPRVPYYIVHVLLYSYVWRVPVPHSSASCTVKTGTRSSSHYYAPNVTVSFTGGYCTCTYCIYVIIIIIFVIIIIHFVYHMRILFISLFIIFLRSYCFYCQRKKSESLMLINLMIIMIKINVIHRVCPPLPPHSCFSGFNTWVCSGWTSLYSLSIRRLPSSSNHSVIDLQYMDE